MAQTKRLVACALVIIELLGPEIALAAQSGLRTCPPTPPGSIPAICDPRWTLWDNATFQFQVAPSSPALIVQFERSKPTGVAVEKIRVTWGSMTHEIAGSELGDLTTDVIGVSADVAADQAGDAYVTLRIFYDVRVSSPTTFKTMQIGISKMQSHKISISQNP